MIGAANWVPTNHTSDIATGLGIVGTSSKFAPVPMTRKDMIAA
ncbi:hypothetical protein A2U01_0057670, partial [Trifolium medium]|nr:hypothetical protein [Trifolium medium]